MLPPASRQRGEWWLTGVAKRVAAGSGERGQRQLVFRPRLAPGRDA
jgi:hypothetical protein